MWWDNWNNPSSTSDESDEESRFHMNRDGFFDPNMMPFNNSDETENEEEHLEEENHESFFNGVITSVLGTISENFKIERVKFLKMVIRKLSCCVHHVKPRYFTYFLRKVNNFIRTKNMDGWDDYGLESCARQMFGPLFDSAFTLQYDPWLRYPTNQI